jgi:hypothetical protein
MAVKGIPSGWQVLARVCGDLLTKAPPRQKGYEWDWGQRFAIPWTGPYLLTLGWSDLIIAVNGACWKDKYLPTALGFVQILAGSFLFIMIINLLEGRSAYQRFGYRLWKTVLVSIVTGLITVVGLLAFIVPGIFAFKHYFYAPYIAATQELGPFNALKRSSSLSRVNGWSCTWIFLVIALASIAIYYGLEAYINWVGIKCYGYGTTYQAYPVLIQQFLGSWISYVFIAVFGYYMFRIADSGEQLSLASQGDSIDETDGLSRPGHSISREVQLEELKSLFEKGLIDLQEYRDAKCKLLDL